MSAVPVTAESSASAGTVRRLRAWSPADRITVGTNLHAALRRWAESWPPIDPNWLEREVEVDAADEVANLFLGDQWCQTGVEGLAWSMMGLSGAGAPPLVQGRTTPQTALMSALFDESIDSRAISVEPRLSEQLTEEAWQEWWREIGRLLAAPDCRGPDLTALEAPAAMVQGAAVGFSGALLARLPWCGQYTLNLLIEARCVQALLVRTEGASTVSTLTRQRTASVMNALSLHRLPLRVELQQVEIDLGSLTSLRVGDILRTTHRLDALLTVHGPASEHMGRSEVLCHAFLGRQSQWRAIELQQADAPAST